MSDSERAVTGGRRVVAEDDAATDVRDISVLLLSRNPLHNKGFQPELSCLRDRNSVEWDVAAGATNTLRPLTESLGDSAVEHSIPTSLYKYYDRSGVLLYVGITSRASTRNQEHNKDKVWWPFVRRQEVKHFRDRSAALAAEKAAIIAERPPFNKQHNRDCGILSAAYLKYAAAVEAKEGAGKVMLRNKGRLPLEVVSFDAAVNVLKLRSKPEDVGLACRIRSQEKMWALHRGMRAYVVNMNVEDFTLVVQMQGKWLAAVTEISAVVDHKRGIYTIRKFEVATEQVTLNPKDAS